MTLRYTAHHRIRPGGGDRRSPPGEGPRRVRATLAQCFRTAVGPPPMTYLTEWRLALAADLPRQSDATLNAAVRQVGYGSGFALSSAFKRLYGISPQEQCGAALAH